MGKYVITRTSSSDDKEPPCVGAVKELLTYIDRRSAGLAVAKGKPWFERFVALNDSYEELDGFLVGYKKREVWTIDTDIETLCNQEGPLVIEESDYKEVPVSIEIYDGYRE